MNKRILTLGLLAALVSGRAMAQGCEMPLSVIVPQQTEAIDAIATSQLSNKLLRIASQTGVAGGSASPFALTAKIDVLGKEILSGSPTMWVYRLGVNLYIVDTADGKIFSATAVEVSCAGASQTKAMINGIGRIGVGNPEIKAFVEQGKAKMLTWYDQNYQQVIKRARSLATLRKFDEALFWLMSMPECCKGYDAAMAEMSIVYKQFVDRKCEENLAQAQAAWMTGFTRENAAVASVFLSEIYPDAACYQSAVDLVREIKQHMGEEWKFELRRWDDRVDIELQRAAYARDIAVAYAENQPRENVTLILR